MSSVNLDRYLDRLQWGGDTAPTFDTLAGLLRAHMTAIPFENLDVLLNRPVRLDLDSLQAKLVEARRGGYCFEHAALFAVAIEALGFHPVRHSARVVLFEPRTQAPRAHMFLTIDLPEGRFVLDPGFGGPAPIVPVPLVDRGAEPTSATHVMVRDGDYWILRAPSGDRMIDGWVSTLEHDHPVDYEMANHFIATHPSSPFVNMMMMSRFTEGGRVTFLNREMTIIEGGQRETTTLADRTALRTAVKDYLGFDLPQIETLRVPAIPEWN